MSKCSQQRRSRSQYRHQMFLQGQADFKANYFRWISHNEMKSYKRGWNYALKKSKGGIIQRIRDKFGAHNGFL